MATENAFFDGGSSPPSTTTIDREVLAQRVIANFPTILNLKRELRRLQRVKTALEQSDTIPNIVRRQDEAANPCASVYFIQEDGGERFVKIGWTASSVHLRVRGEWFRPAPELLDFINGVQQ